MVIAMQNPKITFRELDEIHKKPEESKFDESLAAIENHFLEKKPYEGHFLDLLNMTSQYESHAEWFEQLETTKKTLVGRHANYRTDIEELLAEIKQLVLKCNIKDDYDYIRGNMFEHYFFANRKRKRIGTGRSISEQRGSEILINNQRSKFECAFNKHEMDSSLCAEEECYGKSTSDYIEHDGQSITLYECKVSPNGVNCKELGYFKKLFYLLKNEGYQVATYFVISTGRGKKRKNLEKRMNKLPDMKKNMKIIDRRDLVK